MPRFLQYTIVLNVKIQEQKTEFLVSALQMLLVVCEEMR